MAQNAERVRRPDVGTGNRLRQAMEQAALESGRTERENELGTFLGREGIAPEVADPENVWIAAICHAKEISNALTWLGHRHDEAALERIAMAARSTEIRLAAVRRIGDVSRIHRLAEALKQKDRGVYRYCRDILKREADKHERGERIDALSHRVHLLLDTSPLPRGQLYEVRKQLAALDDGDDLADVRTLLDRLNRQEQEEAGHLHSLENCVARARALSGRLRGDLWPLVEHLGVWRDTADELAAEHRAFPAWLGSHPSLTELNHALKAIEGKLVRLSEDVRRVEIGCRYLEEHANEDTRQHLIDGWESLPKPESPSARDELMRLWSQRLSRARKAPVTTAQKPSPALIDPAGLTQRLADLETAIESGATQRAFRLATELEQLLSGTSLPSSLAKRYRTVRAQLRQLRDWARWSGGNARDHLIEEAEALLTQPVDVTQLAETVPRLRADWKRLDAHSRAATEQWKRFDAALSQAYQPVLAERAERAVVQEAARQAKAAFVDEAENWLRQLRWDEGTIRDIQHQAGGLRRRWRDLAPAGIRDDRKMAMRFQSVMAELEGKIQPFITLETERRQRLVEAANRLRQVTDLQEAVAQARALQQRWRDETTGVQLLRGPSEAQWQSFRAAIDEVFARRNAERADREAKVRAVHTARDELLREFEQSLQGEPEQHPIETALAHFREQWESDEQPQTDRTRQRDPLEQKAAALIRQAENMIRLLRNSRQRAVFERMVRKAALVDEIEAAAASLQPLDNLFQRIEQEWEQIPGLPADMERKLAARYQSARSVTTSALADGHHQRSDLLIDLEILLDLPSPAAFSEARQQRQLEFLQRGFQDLRSTSSLVGTVASWYAIAAAEDRAQSERMEEVISKLGERLAEEAHP